MKPSLFLASLFAVMGAHAGPLAPPPGSVEPTYKTLQQVEPRTPISQDDVPLTITDSGSYYLTENLQPTALGDQHIIRIVAPNVTLDLNGFTIVGSTEAVTALDGISLPDGLENTAIVNGFIVGCVDAGIDGPNADNVRVERVVSSNNSGGGVVLGDRALVSDVTAVQNGGAGFTLGDDAVVERAVAVANSTHGFVLASNSTISACTSRANTGAGFSCASACAFAHCTSAFNGLDGFLAATACTFDSCAALTNEDNGFECEDTCTFDACTARSNGSLTSDDGFHAGDGCTFNACAAVLNSGSGFDVGDRCVIAASAGVGNGGAGVSVDAVCLIEACNVAENAGHGIAVNGAGGNCRIVRNTVTANGLGGQVIYAGIATTTSDDNLIDENYVRGNNGGIYCFGAENVMTRNVVIDCTAGNYNIAAGNKGAPIQTGYGSAGPWDNFSF